MTEMKENEANIAFPILSASYGGKDKADEHF